MRIVNDRKDEEAPSAEMGFLNLLSHVLLSALGYATLAFSPMPSILAESRLTDPWPKVVALGGAIIALLFLQVSLPVMVVVFTLSVFIGASVQQQLGFNRLITQVAMLSVGIGLLALSISSRLNGQSVVEQWQMAVNIFVSRFQEAIVLDKGDYWEALKSTLYNQGPFLYLSAVLMGVWLSIGFAAHMGWLTKNPNYSSDALRKLQFPFWTSIAFLVLLIITHGFPSISRDWVNGFYAVFAVLMVIQGCIEISNLMNGRVQIRAVRSLVYVALILVGFYFLMGLGALGSLSFRKRVRATPRLQNPSRRTVV